MSDFNNNDQNETLDQLLTKTIKSVSIGGEGGNEWTDPMDVRESGPITAIDIRHGKEIDMVKVFYGGTPGFEHGGGGGKEGQFQIPKGYEITQIQARSGDRVDRLVFVATPISDIGDAISSEPFGRMGGDPIIINSPDGLPLRSIAGRAGKRIDQLTFNFGYLYEIQNVKVDMEQLKQELENAELITLDTASFTNGTDIDTTSQFSHTSSVSTTNTASWETSSRFLAGIEMKVSAGIDAEILSFGSETTVKFEFEQTFTYGKETSRTSSTEKSWSVDIPIPARSVTNAYVSIYQAEVKNVPFTYDVVFYEIKDQIKEEAIRIKGKATFSGSVLASDVNVSWKDEPLYEGEFKEKALIKN